jgi:hypothetical protein
MTKTDFALLDGTIDAQAATITGVSVITVGEAKGHGMLIDAQTLLQVKEAAETYSGGLKVKTDHYTGFNEIVGTLKNFVIDGDQLRADLYLLKNHDATPRILEMAELMPDTFGLSISFTGEHEESEGGTVFARCTEIYSADLVDAPAANPTGLFSAKVDSGKKDMDEKQFAEALAAALAPINEKLSAFEAFVTEATTKFAALEYKPEDEEKEMSEGEMPESEDEEKEDMSAKLAAELAEIKSLVTNFGAKPVAAAVAVEAKTEEVKEPTTFSEALDIVKAEGLSGSAATKAVIARFPELYLAARNSGIKTL